MSSLLTSGLEALQREPREVAEKEEEEEESAEEEEWAEEVGMT